MAHAKKANEFVPSSSMKWCFIVSMILSIVNLFQSRSAFQVQFEQDDDDLAESDNTGHLEP